MFIYGGYNEDEDGLDTCKQWVFSEELIIKNVACKLPHKEGFLNNPGTIIDGNIYALQNVCADEGEDESLAGIEEGERALLVFDGKAWK